MVNFLKLVQNENMKIYRRLRAWIMLGCLVLIPILVSVGAKLVSSSDTHLNNWTVMQLESVILYFLVTIFTVVVSADAVAGEFSSGTIKLLLIRPWRRGTILLSKYIALLLFSLLQMAVCFVVTWGINLLIFGNGPADEIITSLSPMAGHSAFAFMSMYYLYMWLQLIVVVTFAFMLSSAFRSGGLAIGLSIFLLFAGNIITNLLSLTHKEWVKYVLFSNLGLTSYLDGAAPLDNMGMTLGFSLAVLAAYFVIFNVVSWSVFCKRDVAA